MLAWAWAERLTRCELGLDHRRLAHSAGWGLLAGAVASLPVRLFFAFPLVSHEAITQPEFRRLSPGRLVWLLCSQFLLSTAVFEEVTFRGVLHAKLARLVGLKRALVIGSAVFAAWHCVITWYNLRRSNLPRRLFWPLFAGAMGALFAAGGMFGLLRLGTGHLAAGVVAHWLIVVNIVIAVARRVNPAEPAAASWAGPAPERYPVPYLFLARLAIDMLRGRRRSVGADSAALLRLVHPSPRAIATEHIPGAGPFVVVANHYQRPGLWVGWGGMVVNAAIHRARPTHDDVRWLMAAEMLDYRLGALTVSRERMARIVGRFARVYGFALVSNVEAGVVGGPAVLRAAARYLAVGDPVGVLPEGAVSVELRRARAGVGTALAWLSRDSIPILPAGVAELDGTLTATFDAPFHLEPAAGDKATRDRALNDAVMARIARLLPREMRGYYA